MSKYLVQISPDPFDFIVVDEDNLESAKRGAYYVGKQEPQTGATVVADDNSSETK